MTYEKTVKDLEIATCVFAGLYILNHLTVKTNLKILHRFAQEGSFGSLKRWEMLSIGLGVPANIFGEVFIYLLFVFLIYKILARPTPIVVEADKSKLQESIKKQKALGWSATVLFILSLVAEVISIQSYKRMARAAAETEALEGAIQQSPGGMQALFGATGWDLLKPAAPKLVLRLIALILLIAAFGLRANEPSE